MSEGKSEQDEPPGWWKQQTQMAMMGRVPSDKEVPPDVEDEADWWRARYQELEKTHLSLRKQVKDMQFQQSSALMKDDTTAEDILTRIWKRGVEAIGAFSFILFSLQVLNQGIQNLTILGQVAGAVTFVAVYETYLRPHLSSD